jgi:ABC-type transport system involved in cytochrome bd biosynthesis fused ATPase/permease subunit
VDPLRLRREAKLHRQAVEIENLSFTYEGGERKIFNNLTLTINAGEKIAVIGENGVGKTTFLKLLMGELTPQFGTIKWAEKAFRATTRRTTAPSSPASRA